MMIQSLIDYNLREEQVIIGFMGAPGAVSVT